MNTQSKLHVQFMQIFLHIASDPRVIFFQL